MQVIFVFILIFINYGISYSDISTLRLFPSFIKVDFTIPVEIQESTKKNKKEQTETTSQTFDKLIRVINSVPLISNNMSLVFYNEENEIIDQILITNSGQPAPQFITFMDRSSNRKFQGKLDLYQIPKNAFSFSIAITDADNKIVNLVKHDLFDQNNSVLLSDYYKLYSQKKILLQFEVVGQEDNLRVVIGAFTIS